MHPDDQVLLSCINLTSKLLPMSWRCRQVTKMLEFIRKTKQEHLERLLKEEQAHASAHAKNLAQVRGLSSAARVSAEEYIERIRNGKI